MILPQYLLRMSTIIHRKLQVGVGCSNTLSNRTHTTPIPSTNFCLRDDAKRSYQHYLDPQRFDKRVVFFFSVFFLGWEKVVLKETTWRLNLCISQIFFTDERVCCCHLCGTSTVPSKVKVVFQPSSFQWLKCQFRECSTFIFWIWFNQWIQASKTTNKTKVSSDFCLKRLKM